MVRFPFAAQARESAPEPAREGAAEPNRNAPDERASSLRSKGLNCYPHCQPQRLLL